MYSISEKGIRLEMIKEINLNIAGAELNISYDNPKNYADVSNLIGKSFKRNKYGLSLWTDVIKYVGCKYRLIDKSTKAIEIYVVGEKTSNHFSLDEIVLVNETPEWGDEGYKKLMLTNAFKNTIRNNNGLSFLKNPPNNNI